MSATYSRFYGSDADDDALRRAFRAGDVPVGVYGLGKMGLPLAAVYADVSGNVTGADVDESVVETVNAGRSPVSGEPGLDDLVSDLVSDGALRADVDPGEVASDSRVHVVIVPTLMDGDRPDTSIVESVARDIGRGLSPGDVVFFESTLPPGTCTDDLVPILEAESGLSTGEFGVAVCPERTLSGRALADIRDGHPKIVGGVDDESTRIAELVYSELVSQDVVPVEDVTTAEAVKVFEGVYRDVNIALANELATHAEDLGIDVLDAIDAANTQPFCDIHTPGAGVGGHCIPYYPHFLMEQVGYSPLVATGRDVNDSMPEYTASLAHSGLHSAGTAPEDASVLVLGLTYRPGVQEVRATPALGVIESLSNAGADVTAVDPLVEDPSPFEDAGATVADLDSLDDAYDAVVLVTYQDEFDALDVPALGPRDRSLVVVDGRQALTELRDHDGVLYTGVGFDE